MRSVADMRQILTAENQLHVASMLERSPAVAAQLAGAELAGLRARLDESMEAAKLSSTEREITPFEGVHALEKMGVEERTTLYEDGCRSIARGALAVLLLAGGQGTRLGSSAPKGCYDIGMPSHKSLFQYHAERLLRVRSLAANFTGVDVARVRLPLLVMTSGATHAETVAFFEAHDYFGLEARDVHFFQQGMLPCLSPGGDMLAETPDRLAMAPNGNGGVYAALRDSGLLDQLDAMGVTSLFQFCVDNALCHVADPTFLALAEREGADCASKVVPKAHAHERVGVLGMQRGQPCVLEYSEIDSATAEATGERGQLLFGAAHICVNWFSLALVRRVASDPACALPLHVARKKLIGLTPEDLEGPSAPEPRELDCVKLELFIFDAFRFAGRMVALQVPREDEFAPVKNAPGSATDSPDTARAIFSAWSRRKLLAAGATVGGTGAPDELVEISPLASYDGEDLSESVGDQVLEPPVHVVPTLRQ